MDVPEIFTSFKESINQEQETREEIRSTVRELEQVAREILTNLQKVHHPDGLKETDKICAESREHLLKVRELQNQLKEKVPKTQFYRYHEHWRFVTQRLVFICAMLVYLEKDQLIAREETAALLGLETKGEAGFHIDLDDFLMGLLQLASELARLAVNAVTSGDYGRPIKISAFVSELDSGFRLLNLKNDSLRKRFDGLKYDLKKIEEVVYDVTIRGLTQTSQSIVKDTK